MKRRQFVVEGTLLGAALAVPTGWVQAQSLGAPADPLAADPAAFNKAMSEFLGGATPAEEGLLLDVPALADNPSAVPVKATLTLPITDSHYCKELILLAERNPSPLVCRFTFTPAMGTAEAAVRVRLSQTQTLHALARMSDGKVMLARQDVTVAGSGCGM